MGLSICGNTRFPKPANRQKCRFTVVLAPATSCYQRKKRYGSSHSSGWSRYRPVQPPPPPVDADARSRLGLASRYALLGSQYGRDANRQRHGRLGLTKARDCGRRGPREYEDRDMSVASHACLPAMGRRESRRESVRRGFSGRRLGFAAGWACVNMRRQLLARLDPYLHCLDQ